MFRKSLPPDAIGGGHRLSEKNMRQRKKLERIPIHSIGMRLEEPVR